MCWKIECLSCKQGYGLSVQYFSHTVMIEKLGPNAVEGFTFDYQQFSMIQRAIAFDL